MNPNTLDPRTRSLVTGPVAERNRFDVILTALG